MSLILETPIILVTGSFYNPDTKQIEPYSDTELSSKVIQSGNTFTSPPDVYTFIGPITISFTSTYPLKTYSTTPRRNNEVIGSPPFGYQVNKAEIRYKITGGGVSPESFIYKQPFTLRHNTSGSDNVVLDYKIFYQGKTSESTAVILNISKTDDGFYSFDENS